MKKVTLRVSEEDWMRWKAAALASGETLQGWVLGRVDAGVSRKAELLEGVTPAPVVLADGVVVKSTSTLVPPSQPYPPEKLPTFPTPDPTSLRAGCQCRVPGVQRVVRGDHHDKECGLYE